MPALAINLLGYPLPTVDYVTDGMRAAGCLRHRRQGEFASPGTSPLHHPLPFSTLFGTGGRKIHYTWRIVNPFKLRDNQDGFQRASPLSNDANHMSEITTHHSLNDGKLGCSMIAVRIGWPEPNLQKSGTRLFLSSSPRRPLHLSNILLLLLICTAHIATMAPLGSAMTKTYLGLIEYLARENSSNDTQFSRNVYIGTTQAC